MAEPAVRPPQFLQAGDVARELHVSPKTVARWSAEGKIPFIRTLGGHRRFDPAVIAMLVQKAQRDGNPEGSA